MRRFGGSVRLLVAALIFSTALASALVPQAAQANATSSITPRGAATAVAYPSESTTKLTLAVPPGTQAGDVLIASLGFGVTGATTQPTLSALPGWALASRTNMGAVATLAVFWHVFASGETSYTWVTNVKVGGTAFLAAYGGADTTNPIDVSLGQTTPTKASAVATPSVTTTAANEMLVASYFGYRGNGSAIAWSPPAGMAEIGDLNNGGSRSGCVDNAVQAAAGATGTKTAIPSGPQDYGIAALTALRVAAAPADTTPPVITGVSAGTVTTTGAAVAWTTDEASDSQVEYGLTSAYGSSTTLNATLALAHSVALSGLSAGTTYHYRVKSHDAAGNLATSADFTLTTVAAADTTPPVISGVGAGSVTSTGAAVAWTTDEASDSQVEYGPTSSYGSSTVLDATPVAAHSVALGGLAAGTAYHYRVKSRDAAGNLATSADFTFTTAAAADTTPPVISGVGAGSVTSTGAAVAWTTDEASDSQIEYGLTSSYGASTTLDATLVVAHSVVLAGLAAGTAYHYRVNSRDAAGNLATSADFTFTTAATADTTPPVISGVGAGSVTSAGAAVAWTTDEASDSQVEYGLTSSYGSSTTLDTSLVIAHSLALSGLTPGTAYHYRVTSHDAAGNLATSPDFAFTTAAAADVSPPVISGVGAGTVTTSGATVTWTTDEASDSQVEYGLTSAYGSTTTLNATLVLAHSVALSGLAAGTTYHYRVKSHDAAGNLAISADFSFTTNASTAGPVPVIVDTDIFSDADDVGALATVFALQLKGEANVVAIGVNTRTSRPAVATNSWKCAAAVAQFYGFGSVPIGSDMPENGTATNTYDFIGPCSQLASPSTPSPDTAVNVFRRALAAQPNGSVVMIEIGYEENLSALLHSSPDSISALSGRDLISQKVKTLVIMGGGYPSRSGETNLIGNIAAAQDVASNWPTKIVWSGYEVGDAVHTGNTISRTHPANSPVRVSYEAFVGPNNWIYSYDLTAIYHAVRPRDPVMPEVGPGTNVVDNSGGNVFTMGSGTQYYLGLTNATTLDTSIETLLDTLPADTTAPVISTVVVGSVSASSAPVTWMTNDLSDSQVDYGLTSSYGSSSALSSALVVSHVVTLSGLATGTTYHYRVKSRDAAGNLATSPDFTFTTATSAPSGPSDTFDGNTIDPAKWSVILNGSTVAAANQELEITHPAGTTWTKASIQCAVAYDQTGKSVQVQLKRAANNGLDGSTYGETSVFLWLDANHYVEFFVAGGAMTAWVNSGSGEVNLTPGWPRYSTTTMQWLRFREAGGTLYWEYASGTTAPGVWTILASTADPFPLTAITFKIAAGANVSSTDTAQFDNISIS